MAKVKMDSKQLFIRFMDIGVWTLIFIALLLFEKARPETATVLDARYEKDVRDIWDLAYASYSMWIFIVASIVSGLGLLINLSFLREEKYHISYGMSIALIFSLIAASAYMFILL